jgi:SAM-dependent methyltransferase
MANLDYHDHVIKDGKLVGNWDGAYSSSPDPWNQSAVEHVQDSRRVIAKSWVQRLRGSFENQTRVIEVGCGFGHLTHGISVGGACSLGIDISRIAIDRARSIYPNDNFQVGGFDDWHIYDDFKPDIFILSEITWYVLNELPAWLNNLHQYSFRERPTYLIHLLATYPKGVQKYGLEYFSDLKSILNYFKLNYLEYGETVNPLTEDVGLENLRIGTYFIAKI